MNYKIKHHMINRLVPAGVFLGIGLMVIASMGLYQISKSADKDTTYTIDSFFSDEYTHVLQDAISTLLNQHGPDYMIERILEHYPSVKKISCRYKPVNRVHVIVEAHDPLLLINDTNIMIDQGILVSKNIFDKNCITTVPTISIATIDDTADTVPTDMYAFLITIPSWLYQTYTVHWHNNHSLLLYEKNTHDVVFVCDATQVLDQKTLETCQAVAKDYRAALVRKHHFVIDARFANQIIVYGDTGEYGHGSRIG